MTLRSPLPSLGPGSPWRSTWLHGGLLALALFGAWLSFARPFADDAAGAAAGVVVVRAAEGEVERLVHERGDRTLEIEAREDGLGRWFEGREGAGAPFAGGRQVEAAWRGLEPLRAVRVLEGVDEAKLGELGLAGGDSPAEFLTLTVRGLDIRFRLGGRPFGGADRYARREAGPDGEAAAPGRVLVLPADVVSGLGGADLLMERRLLAASRPDVEAMTLQRPGARTGEPLTIRQRTGANPADAFWTLDGAERADADIAAWVDKFFRLSVAAYRGGEPAADWRPEAIVAVEAREHGASRLEIWSAPAGEGRAWLARSPFTRLVVELSAPLAEEVCADLDGLIPG